MALVGAFSVIVIADGSFAALKILLERPNYNQTMRRLRCSVTVVMSA